MAHSNKVFVIIIVECDSPGGKLVEHAQRVAALRRVGRRDVRARPGTRARRAA